MHQYFFANFTAFEYEKVDSTINNKDDNRDNRSQIERTGTHKEDSHCACQYTCGTQSTLPHFFSEVKQPNGKRQLDKHCRCQDVLVRVSPFDIVTK